LIDIAFTERDEQYLKCLAKGLTDVEIAQHMRVKLWHVQNEYRHSIGDKTGLWKKEDMVQYAIQNGYGTPEEGHDDNLYRILRGIEMAPTRDFYRHLLHHFYANDCAVCKSYNKYKVLLVYGNFVAHMSMLAKDGMDIDTMLSRLQKAKLLQIRRDDVLYRIYFLHLQKQEED